MTLWTCVCVCRLEVSILAHKWKLAPCVHLVRMDVVLAESLDGDYRTLTLYQKRYR